VCVCVCVWKDWNDKERNWSGVFLQGEWPTVELTVCVCVSVCVCRKSWSLETVPSVHSVCMIIVGSSYVWLTESSWWNITVSSALQQRLLFTVLIICNLSCEMRELSVAALLWVDLRCDVCVCVWRLGKQERHSCWRPRQRLRRLHWAVCTTYCSVVVIGWWWWLLMNIH